MARLLNKDFFENNDETPLILHRKPQECFPEHSHEFNEIFIVEQGSGIHEMNGKSYLLTPGTVFYIQPNDCHLFDHVYNLNLVNLVYNCTKDFHFIKNIHHLLPRIDQPCWKIPHKICQKLFKMLEVYDTLKQSPPSLYDQCEKELLFIHTIKLLCQHYYQENEQHSNAEKFENLIILLQANYDTDIQWESLANQFHLSYRTLHRQCVQQLGLSPQKYLSLLRLTHARALLKQSNLAITDIAFQVGFNDSNHFATLFKKSFGISPSHFRSNSH